MEVATGSLRDYQLNFIERELLPLGLGGRRLLEVGAGHGEICQELASRVPSIREIVGINIENIHVEGGDNWRLDVMDARSLAFPDESFDIVYSLATFEHIHDLHLALAEMHRVLKRGGLLVAVWSPIWNGFNGHHYGRTLSDGCHSDITLPWAHHLLTPRRLKEYLVSGEGFSPEEAASAVGFIYEAPWLNRLWYRDYRRLFDASPLEDVRVDGLRVDFPGLLHRVGEAITAEQVRPEELISFFSRVPPDEILTYKMRVVARRSI